jgi:hypothetical protein
MVLQRVKPGLGNVAGVHDTSLQLRSLVIPTDPRTASQLANRARFADAQAAWYALPQIERDQWSTAARSHALTGRQLHSRAYIAAHPL